MAMAVAERNTPTTQPGGDFFAMARLRSSSLLLSVPQQTAIIIIILGGLRGTRHDITDNNQHPPPAWLQLVWRFVDPTSGPAAERQKKVNFSPRHRRDPTKAGLTAPKCTENNQNTENTTWDQTRTLNNTVGIPLEFLHFYFSIYCFDLFSFFETDRWVCLTHITRDLTGRTHTCVAYNNTYNSEVCDTFYFQ